MNKKSVEKLSKNELIDEVLSLENFKNDINVMFSELNEFKYRSLNVKGRSITFFQTLKLYKIKVSILCN